jgi:hypothetical protein
MLSQFIRLTVLFEDLRVEVNGAQKPEPLKALDEAGVLYRELYFLRRTFITIAEIDQSLHKLNKCKEFKSPPDLAPHVLGAGTPRLVKVRLRAA